MRLGSKGTIYPTLSLLHLDLEIPRATHSNTFGGTPIRQEPCFYKLHLMP